YIATRLAIELAFALDMVMGASINTLLLMLFISNDAGIDYVLYFINSFAIRTTYLYKIALILSLSILYVYVARGVPAISNEFMKKDCTSHPARI
ncbi:dihydroxy-acid dehydratase domain-containing protein, partial [Staphylococcus aureus]